MKAKRSHKEYWVKCHLCYMILSTSHVVFLVKFCKNLFGSILGGRTIHIYFKTHIFWTCNLVQLGRKLVWFSDKFTHKTSAKKRNFQLIKGFWVRLLRMVSCARPLSGPRVIPWPNDRLLIWTKLECVCCTMHVSWDKDLVVLSQVSSRCDIALCCLFPFSYRFREDILSYPLFNRQSVMYCLQLSFAFLAHTQVGWRNILIILNAVEWDTRKILPELGLYCMNRRRVPYDPSEGNIFWYPIKLGHSVLLLGYTTHFGVSKLKKHWHSILSWCFDSISLRCIKAYLSLQFALGVIIMSQYNVHHWSVPHCTVRAVRNSNAQLTTRMLQS